MDRIALISDIHGNIPALEATLTDIKRRDISRILCLGDLVGKGPHSEQAVDICRSECEVTLRGNWDDFLTRESDEAMPSWHRRRLGQERLDYLKSLPDTFDFALSGKRVRLFHASQQGVYHRVYMTDSRENHMAMFASTDFTCYRVEPDVVGYGDIHQAYVMSYPHKILFNVGSVGNPLDLTQASYAILDGQYGSDAPGSFSIQLIRVPYDIELAVRQAEDEQMPDVEPYARELRTARYRGAKLSE